MVSVLGARSDASALIRVGGVLFIAALTAAAAQVSFPVPFTPVPLVLQDMIVLIGGAALGSRLGMAAQLVYLAAGIAGLPVFAASATLPQGPLRFLGPTGGYLISYPLRGVPDRVPRRARLRSPLLDVRAGDGRRPAW